MKIDRASVVPFVGAGISRAANLPTWRGLADAILEAVYGFRLANEAEVAHVRSQDPLAILAFCRSSLGDEMFRRQVTSVLALPRDAKDFTPPEVARLCWRINEEFVVTTNLDEVLERAAPQVDGLPAQALTPADALAVALRQGGRRTLHLHGTLPRFETWIMTPEDYDKAVSPTSPTGLSL
jgi:NAD-dependent SIR2 family protein deacetylase